MHRTVSLYARHIRKDWRTDGHVEVAFPTFLIPTMTAVTFAIIYDFQVRRREGRSQFVVNLLCYTHVFSKLPFTSLLKTLKCLLRV